MSRYTVRAGLIVLAAVVVPGADAQTRAVTARAPAAAPSREEARASMAELQGITTRLQAAHNRAMEDPGLRSAQQTLARDVKAAMERADPELPQLAERIRRMEEEARAAQQRGDGARVQALTRDFALIRQRFSRAQNVALQNPLLAARARSFDQELHRRMLAVEPETDLLLARSRELQERLRGALGARRQGPQRTP